MARSFPSLDSVLSRSRWTAPEARVVVTTLEASGLSVAAFAARYHVQAQRLFTWRRKLATAGSAPTRSVMPFVELGATSTVRLPTRYEVVLASGDRVHIEGPIDADAVRTLLALLRE